VGLSLPIGDGLVLVCPADIDMKKAGKMFGQKFACGSSVSGDEITVQGDISDELMDYILECFPVC
jgi:density-regulated protein DRP1